MSLDPSIELKGVKSNNLKDISVNFPIGKMTVVSGVSGSGKSSLVFETLYAESYRRFIESLSSFARQFIQAVPKPELSSITNLPPSIAVRQRRMNTNNRSTVGTLTEIDDLTSTLFSQFSQVVCTNCDTVVTKDTAASICNSLVDQYTGAKIIVLASLKKWQKVSTRDLKGLLEAQGFSRIVCGKEVKKLADLKKIDASEDYIVIDRVKIDQSSRPRLLEALNLALKAGNHYAAAFVDDAIHTFSGTMECNGCGEDYNSPSVELFSFNSPLGACHSCNGFGQVSILDWDKIIPDRQESLATKGVAVLNFGKHVIYYQKFKKSAAKIGFDISTPFSDYSEDEWNWLLEGEGRFKGILGYFAWLDSKKYKAHYRIHSARFHKYVLCQDCSEKRLNPKALACKILDKDVADVRSMSIGDINSWLHDALERGVINTSIEKEGLDELQTRINYLVKVGVDYLTPSRVTNSLSGGEIQRINMARCLGGALTEVLYCLDEPTAGLHPQDRNRLMSVLHLLRDQGNTVVIVEHDEEVIQQGDHSIVVGPEAGHLGGEVVYQGLPSPNKMNDELLDATDTKTLSLGSLQLEGASTHNLKNISVELPLGTLIGVCGVSGSGKSSLIVKTFVPKLEQLIANGQADGLLLKGGLEPDELRLVVIDQKPLQRSSRSNIATYLGIYDEIRKLLSTQPLSSKYKLKPAAFSFNVKGGRCETCKGLGRVTEDLSFLGEVDIICPECDGKKFDEKVLQVKYREKNVIDILRLTVAEAREFFFDNKKVSRMLDSALGLGLGYLTLGQNTSSFSGGEAQRLKLLNFWKEKPSNKRTILVLDEPTTGLSDKDVAILYKRLAQLKTDGHTLIVIEHHTGFLKACDWLIELGPGGGPRGGTLLFSGGSNDIKNQNESIIKHHLKP